MSCLCLFLLVAFKGSYLLHGFLTDENKRSRTTLDLSFGSSAIFSLQRPAAFRPLLTKGLALSGKCQKIWRDFIKGGTFVNVNSQIVKIIFIPVKWSKMVSI